MYFTEKIDDLRTQLLSVGWDGVFDWTTNKSLRQENKYQAGLGVKDLSLRSNLLNQAGLWFVLASVDTRTALSSQIHTLNTVSARPVLRSLYGSRVPAKNPLTSDELVDFFTTMKTYWTDRIGYASDQQAAHSIILDELITRWYRRDRTASSFALESSLDMVRRNVSLEGIIYYSSVSYKRLLGGRKAGYYHNVKKNYITLDTLEALNVDKLPFEVVKTFLQEGALPELV